MIVKSQVNFIYSFIYVINFILNYQLDFDYDYTLMNNTIDVQSFENKGRKNSIYLSNNS